MSSMSPSPTIAPTVSVAPVAFLGTAEKAEIARIDELLECVRHSHVRTMNFFAHSETKESLSDSFDSVTEGLDGLALSLNDVIALSSARLGLNDSVGSFLAKIRSRLLDFSSEIRGGGYLGSSVPELQSVFSAQYSEINDQYWGVLEILRQRKEEVVEIATTVRAIRTEVDLLLDTDAALAKEIIEKNRVHIFGQGIFDRNSVRIDEEVLVRGVDSAGRIIYPDQLLKGVEAIGQIDTFDWLVIENACIHISEHGKHAETYGINVNPITFSRPDFYGKLCELFHRYGINERNIILEILEYETFKEEDCARIDDLFGKLRKRGVRIAVDDYPSGSNTLSKIIRFRNIDIVKIDGIHVRNMFLTCSACESVGECVDLMEASSSRNDAMCLKSVHQDYKLETLIFSMRFLKANYPHVSFFAERVEDESVRDFLMNLELIEGFQGYFYEKPKLLSSSDLLRRSMRGIDLDHANAERKTAAAVSVPAKATELVEVIVAPTDMETYVRMLDSYTASVIELHSFLRKGNTLIDIKHDETAKAALVKSLNFLGANRLSFYVKGESGIRAKTVSIEAEVSEYDLPLDPGGSRVNKEYLNLYRLISDSSDLKRADFAISRLPIPGEGDDVVVEALPGRVYVGIDDSENAVFHSKDSQINLLILLVISMREIYP